MTIFITLHASCHEMSQTLYKLNKTLFRIFSTFFGISSRIPIPHTKYCRICLVIIYRCKLIANEKGRPTHTLNRNISGNLFSKCSPTFQNTCCVY